MYFTYKDRCRLFARGIENIFCYLTKRECSPPVILWELTQRCNLTCTHCASHLNRDKIDTRKLEHIARRIAESDTVMTVITGGEPLIVPNIKEIITILKKSNKSVVLNTNAVHLDTFADFLTDIKLDYLNVSIDSHLAGKHDKIRRQEGNYRRILDNLDVFKKRNKNLTRLGIRCVVMKQNYMDMEHVIRQFSRYADNVKFQPVHHMEHRHLTDQPDVLFDPKDRQTKQRFETIIHKITKKYRPFRSRYYQLFPNFFFNIRSMYRESIRHCLPVLFFSVFIRPSGDVYTCDRVIGNITSQNIKDIWRNPEKRKFLSGLCHNDACEHPCWINSSVMETPYLGRVLVSAFKAWPRA